MPSGSHARLILSIDRGSSSLKVAVHEVGPNLERRLLEGEVESIGSTDASVWMRDERPAASVVTRKALGARSPVVAALDMLEELSLRVDAVGHRLVYGGLAHETPARVTAGLMTSLDGLVPFDPLHMPSALAAIREIETVMPKVPQVACFDTAFHRTMPGVAQRLPLPRKLWLDGVRRYGYHGLSYESIVRELGPAGTGGKMIVAHLGSGASLAAIADGKPIDTTMGFSPLGGLMMGTRPGDLDPGVLLFLLRTGSYTPAKLEELITLQSGLLGVSDISADMHALLDCRSTSVPAAEAVELFVYEARKHIGGLSAALDGLDTFVFTGGIGERSAPVRWEIGLGLAHLGVEIDAARNAEHAPVISTAASRVLVRVIATNETLMLALHTYDTLFPSVRLTSQIHPLSGTLS